MSARKKSPSKSKKKPMDAKPQLDPLSEKPRRAIIARLSKVTEADLTDGLDEDLRDAWKKLRAFGASLGRQHIYPSPQSIMFARKVCYFYVRPRKKFLEVWFFLPHKVEGLVFMQGPSKKEKY